jgi:cytochrome P450
MNAVTTTHFDPLSATFLADPYGELNRMRETCRAYRHPESACRAVSVFRDEDVRAIATDWQQWSSDRGVEFRKGNLGEATVMFYDDPPLHTELRRVVAPFFLPGRVRPLETSIREHCDRLLDSCLAAGRFDLVDDLASRLTITVISEMLGLPEEAFTLIRHWTEVLEEFDGVSVFWSERRPEVERGIADACAQMSADFGALIRQRQHAGGEDLVSAMMAGGFTARQASGLCQLLIIAGQATTANLIGNVMALLMDHPEQMRLLRADHGLATNAVEEALRLRSQIRKLERIAQSDSRIGEVEIRAGDFVALWLAAAKRDPRRIERPDVFDIQRSKIPHVAFGTGIHMCLGNALARMESRVLRERLLVRTRRIDYADGQDGIVRGINPAMDTVVHLPLEVEAAA